MTDVDILLILPIIVLFFSAFELGAIITKKYHTISWYAQRNLPLRYLIYVLFFAGGVSGALWWGHHMGMVIPQ